jgi:hypothetical protein
LLATVFRIELIMPLSPVVCRRTLVRSRGWVQAPAMDAATPGAGCQRRTVRMGTGQATGHCACRTGPTGFHGASGEENCGRWYCSHTRGSEGQEAWRKGGVRGEYGWSEWNRPIPAETPMPPNIDPREACAPDTGHAGEAGAPTSPTAKRSHVETRVKTKTSLSTHRQARRGTVS